MILKAFQDKSASLENPIVAKGNGTAMGGPVFNFVPYIHSIKPQKFKCILVEISVRVESAIYKEKLEWRVDRFSGEPLLTG